MKSGGHKAKITFVDQTQHQIPHEEQDALIQRAPAGTAKMIATEEGESEGHRLKLEVIRAKNPPLVCKVVGTNCVDALDKLQACLDRARAQRDKGEETKPVEREPERPRPIGLKGFKNLKGFLKARKPDNK